MHRALLILPLSAALAAGCQGIGAPVASAVAELEPTAGNNPRGSAYFHQVGERVRLRVAMTGLQPNREHGFHVHEVGDCSQGGLAAKGHFNPYGKPHAHYSTPERHAGDLPALRADAAGRAHLDVELDVISLSKGPANIVGRALIVHADPDDFRTQPHGNAGPPIACGVIRAEPAT